MGHYCYECGEKIVGGICPIACNCIECFCTKCWEDLFSSLEYIQNTQDLYIKQDDGTFIKTVKKYFILEEKEGDVKCPKCGIVWEDVSECEEY